MDKITVAGRTNGKDKVYIRFKATDSSIKVIKKIVEEFGSEYFVDDQFHPKSLSKYEKWRDQWIPIATKDFGFDIVCGDKFIHVIFFRFPSLERVNAILDKYCVWASAPKK